jgi:hypothetical protein
VVQPDEPVGGVGAVIEQSGEQPVGAGDDGPVGAGDRDRGVDHPQL